MTRTIAPFTRCCLPTRTRSVCRASGFVQVAFQETTRLNRPAGCSFQQRRVSPIIGKDTVLQTRAMLPGKCGSEAFTVLKTDPILLFPLVQSRPIAKNQLV
jgi:hypothetical protein